MNSATTANPVSGEKAAEASAPSIKVGECFEVTFALNPKPESRFRFRATRIAKKDAPKAILSNDPRIRPGKRCRVRVTRITRPSREDRGAMIVSFVSGGKIELDPSVYVEASVANKLQAFLENSRNCLLIGPQGSGKTVISEAICRALGFSWVYFNAAAVLEATDFLGQIQLRATPEGGTATEWIKTSILTTIETARGQPDTTFAIFLDEVNRCRPHALAMFFPALDGTRKIYNPVSASFVDIPRNIVFLAAINTGITFSGTHALDMAFLDRWAPLFIDYPTEAAEVRLIAKRVPTLQENWIRKVVRLANKVRQSKESPGDISVRATLEACELLAHPLFADRPESALENILTTSFCGRFAGRPSDPSTESGAVYALLKAHLRAP